MALLKDDEHHLGPIWKQLAHCCKPPRRRFKAQRSRLKGQMKETQGDSEGVDVQGDELSLYVQGDELSLNLGELQNRGPAVHNQPPWLGKERLLATSCKRHPANMSAARTDIMNSPLERTGQTKAKLQMISTKRVFPEASSPTQC